jgi:hypothetical protein
MYNEGNKQQMKKQQTKRVKFSTLALIRVFLLNIDKPKKLSKEIKILQDATQLRKRPIIKSRYKNCLLLLSPFRICISSQQTTIWQHNFISQTCCVPSLLSESNADDQLCLMDLIIIYLKYLSG